MKKNSKLKTEDLSVIDIDYVSRLANLPLTSKEKALFEKQLKDVLNYIAKLNEIDTDKVEPIAHISDLTIRETSGLLSSKQINAQELTQAFLERAHGLNKKLNSFITITDNNALNQAKKVDELIANGQKLNLLAGIP